MRPGCPQPRPPGLAAPGARVSPAQWRGQPLQRGQGLERPPPPAPAAAVARPRLQPVPPPQPPPQVSQAPRRTRPHCLRQLGLRAAARGRHPLHGLQRALAGRGRTSGGLAVHGVGGLGRGPGAQVGRGLTLHWVTRGGQVQLVGHRGAGAVRPQPGPGGGHQPRPGQEVRRGHGHLHQAAARIRQVKQSKNKYEYLYDINQIYLACWMTNS